MVPGPPLGPFQKEGQEVNTPASCTYFQVGDVTNWHLWNRQRKKNRTESGQGPRSRTASCRETPDRGLNKWRGQTSPSPMGEGCQQSSHKGPMGRRMLKSPGDGQTPDLSAPGRGAVQLLESPGCWAETTLCGGRRVASQKTLAWAGKGAQ